MLNVTIQNDGKINFQSECSSTKEMRSNVNLLLAVVSSMEMEEKANKNAKRDPVQTNYFLYLNKVKDGNKLSAVNTLARQLNIPSEKAKDIIDKVIADDKHEILLTQSTDLDSISNVRNTLESVGCICTLLMKRLDDGKCDLVLTWVDQNRKLLAIKELKENIELWLRDAKGYIDSYCAGKKVILLTGDEDEVEKAAKKFESSECLRVCISKH